MRVGEGEGEEGGVTVGERRPQATRDTVGAAASCSIACPTSSTESSRMQSWWPSGQVRRPHGEQGRSRRISSSDACSERLSRGSIGPCRTIVGRSKAAAICRGPLSVLTTTVARRITALARPKGRSSSSARLATCGEPACDTSFLASSRSPGPQWTSTRAPGMRFRAKPARAANRSVPHYFAGP